MENSEIQQGDSDLRFFPDALSDPQTGEAKPRLGQLEAARRIVDAFNSGYKYVLFLGPTGAGKSAIGVSVHNMMAYQMMGFRSFILTPFIVLQDQYLKTAPYAQLYEGRSNLHAIVRELFAVVMRGIILRLPIKSLACRALSVPMRREKKIALNLPLLFLTTCPIFMEIAPGIFLAKET